MFRSWERSTRIAFVSAIVLLILSFLMARFAPAELRQPALIGFVGLIFVSQIIFMWGNRHMVTPFTQAQRRYLAEDFEGARIILEKLDEDGKASASALTLLANTYRQLGLLSKSEEIVKKALALQPFDHFPLYSFGRTLLVEGKYAEAVNVLRQSLEAGAPPIVQIDLGEALYHAGEEGEARMVLGQASELNQESFRVLMTQYLLYRMGSGLKPSPDTLREGLPYWQSTVNRFQHTPYGQALAQDVANMQTLQEES
jgi:tetratricopeptide (TPR) repeat protein